MASEEHNPLAESGVTMHSDSEQYSAGEENFTSPPSSSDSPALILYKPPTPWSLLRGVAINLFLPFINGMMLGFGELFAHEAAFRLGWGGTKVCSMDNILQLHCGFLAIQNVVGAVLTKRHRFSLCQDVAHIQ